MASDIRFKHPVTCIIGGPTGSESLHSVYAFYRTSISYVQSLIFQVELSGVTANRVPCPTIS
jgi:hypothetical protein